MVFALASAGCSGLRDGYGDEDEDDDAQVADFNQAIPCDWVNPKSGPLDVYLRVGDDGKGGRFAAPCTTGNALSVLKGAAGAHGPG